MGSHQATVARDEYLYLIPQFRRADDKDSFEGNHPLELVKAVMITSQLTFQSNQLAVFQSKLTCEWSVVIEGKHSETEEPYQEKHNNNNKKQSSISEWKK